jgi:hypothetical protein
MTDEPKISERKSQEATSLSHSEKSQAKVASKLEEARKKLAKNQEKKWHPVGGKGL